MSERYRAPEPVRVAPGELSIAPLFPDTSRPPPPPGPTPEQVAQQEDATRRDQALTAWHAEQERNAPGRYELIPERDAQQRTEQWRKEHASTGVAGDIWRGLGLGVEAAPKALREIVRAIPKVGPSIVDGIDSIDRWRMGRSSETIMQENEERLRAEQTPAYRDAQQKRAIEEVRQPDGSVSYRMGSGWADPRWYLSNIVESLPSTALTMVPAASLARSAYVGAIAKGATETAAAAAASRMALIAGGVGEGLISGGSTAGEIREQVAKLPEQTLQGSEAYQALIQSGKSPAEARAALADDLAVKGMLIAGVATGMLGGVGDRAIAKIVAEGVQGGLGRRLLAGGVRGAIAEGLLEEAPQSGVEQMAQNFAMQGADPSRRLMEDVPNSMATGGITGGMMGAGMGSASGAARRAAGAPAPVLDTPSQVSREQARGAAAASGDPSAPRGPLASAVAHAERETGTPAGAVNAGAPVIGADVQVNVPGVGPVSGKVEGYAVDGEPIVRMELADPETGEVRTETLQVPLANLAGGRTQPTSAPTPPAPAVDAAPEVPRVSDAAPPMTPSAYVDRYLAGEGRSDTPADKAMQQYAANFPREIEAEFARRTPPPDVGRIPPDESSMLPPRADTVSLADIPTRAPRPGQRAIADGENTNGRHGVTVLGYEGDAAHVRFDDGREMQLPFSELRVNGLSEQAVRAREAKENPPVSRETVTGVNTLGREVLGKQITFPDQEHTDLYDFGKLRAESKRTLGRGALDLDTDRPTAMQQQLADHFGVTPQRLAQIAEDYRYRATRAAKQSSSRTPVKLHPVRDAMLGRKKAGEQAGGNQPEKQAALALEAGEQREANWAATDVAAHEAATSPQNDRPEPSQAQKEAGNYRLGHLRVGGFDISIENPAGSTRSGTDKTGKPWSVTMKSHYGYFRGTTGRDKDHIDVFVKAGTEALTDASPAFVVDQVEPGTGRFDEHKVLLGFTTVGQARAAYLANYAAGWKGLGGVTKTTVGDLKAWFAEGDTTQPFASAKKAPAKPTETNAERGERMKAEVGPPTAAGTKTAAKIDEKVDASARGGRNAHEEADNNGRDAGEARSENTERTVPAEGGRDQGETTEAGRGAAAPAGLIQRDGLSFRDTRGQGIQLHGTSRPGLELANEHYSTLNYYGQGFYTTDAADVAYGYSNRGSQASGGRYIYRITENRELRILDGEASIPTDVMTSISPDPNARPGGLESVLEMAIAERPANMRELYDHVREIGTGEEMSADTIQELFDAINWNMRQLGYDGMSHLGGLRTGAQPHRVVIYFSPQEDISIERKDASAFGAEEVSENAGKINPAAATAADVEKPDVSKAAKTVVVWGGANPVELGDSHDGLAGLARDIVLERGRRERREHLLAIDDAGSVRLVGAGSLHGVPIPPQGSAILQDPANAIVVHHNHPADSPLSAGDVALLANPGVYAIYAHGPSRVTFRASLSPVARDRANEMNDGRRSAKTALRAAFIDIESGIAAHERPQLQSILKRFAAAAIGQRHVVNMVLSRAGITDYRFANLPEGVRQYENAIPSDLIERKAADARRIFFGAARAPVRDDRRADLIRHPGDVGITFDVPPIRGADAGSQIDGPARDISDRGNAEALADTKAASRIDTRPARAPDVETPDVSKAAKTRTLIGALEKVGATMQKARAAAAAEAARAEATLGGFLAEVEGVPVATPEEMAGALATTARRMVEEREEGRQIGRYGEFELAIEPGVGVNATLLVVGDTAHDIPIPNVTRVDRAKLAQHIERVLRRLAAEPARLDTRIAENDQNLIKMRASLEPAPADGGKASVPSKPVASLRGDELGVEFRGAADMPALRRAAQRWYDEHLRGTTALMSDGSTVGFNRRGSNKSAGGGKGDLLLRMVPAIRAIIENGEVVLREPGAKADVQERVVVAAPVSMDGKTFRLAVSVHRRPDGNWQYDFNFDNRAAMGGEGAPGVNSGGPATREGPLPSLDVPRPRSASDTAADKASLAEIESEFNLFVWAEPSSAAPSLRSDLVAGPTGAMVRRLLDGGRIVIADRAPAGAPAGVQGWTAPDGTVTLVAPAIAAGQAQAVLLHEMFHAGVRPLVGDAAWHALLDRLGRLYRQFDRSGGAARTFFDRARARVARAGATGDLAIEEFGAYAIEEYEGAPRALKGWVDDVVGRVKAWVLARFGTQLGRVTPAQLRALAAAALRSESAPTSTGKASAAPPDVRSAGIPAAASEPIATFRNDAPLKAHPDYRAAKAGDIPAATRLVLDLVRGRDFSAARERFGRGALYVPVIAKEQSGNNKIPNQMAAAYAARADGRDVVDIVQSNRAFHTGAGAMERVATRATFDGPVEKGGRYVLVDDVTVMGSTLADLANHIRRGGGDVVGIVTLVNASRTGVLAASPQAVRDVERRFGHVVEELFGIAPSGLTAGEAAYLRNFRDADALRARAVAARSERSERLHAKGAAGRNDAAAGGGVKPPDGAKYSLSLGQMREQVADIDMRRLRDRVSGTGTDIQPTLLAMVPLNYFSELKRPNMKSVDAYLRYKRDMDTYRASKQEATVGLAEDWRRFAGANRRGAQDLAGLMHEATLAQFDPAVAKPEAGNAGQADLAKRWSALPPMAQDLYRRVRDAYSEQQAELDSIILANLDKTHLFAEQKADENYRASLEKVRRDASLTEGEKREQIEKLEGKRDNERLRSLWSHKARMTRLRQKFEASRLPAPYFPLVRFGRYFVTIKDVEGQVVSFSRFESEGARRTWVRENWSKMQEDMPGVTKDEGVIDEKGKVGDGMDARVVGDLSTLLSNAGVDDSVMDAVWQRYLQTMPDFSIRKRYIHRKGTAGFQADALRGFAHHMFHAAHQMGRLKYGADLGEALNAATIEAKRSDDPTRGGTLMNEMRKRHDWVMNPVSSSKVAAVTSAMFVWYLAATPAAAILNMTQPFMIGLPVLGAKLGGLPKASAALLRAAKDTVTGRGTIRNSAGLSAQEKAAIEAAEQAGAIDRTQAHDLAGIGETGAEYSPLRHSIMKKISWGFHRAEVWNREVTVLAAYRLARESGLTHHEAIDKAVDLNAAINFDASNTNRPRILQNDWAKLAFVFQSYQLNMWYRIFRDIHQSIKGETAEGRREARVQLAGIMGMMSLLGGLTGVAGYSVLTALAGAIFGSDDDPFEFKNAIERNIIALFGAQIGGMILKGVPGHLAGVDLTSRIGMPEFLIRTPNDDKDPKNWWMQYLVNAAGVVPSTMLSTLDGFSMVASGKVARGVEVMAPKGVRDLMKAYRYSNEGVVNRRGDEIVARDRLSAWEIIAQASGFTPAEISETYERGSRLRAAQFKVMQERRELLNRYALAVRLGDEEGRSSAMERIRAWNAKPYAQGLTIGSDAISQSLTARARAANRREDGIVIPNRSLSRNLREGLGERVY